MFVLFLLSSTAIIFLHCLLNILRYGKIFCEIDDQVIFWVLIVNPFSLLCSISFFCSRNLGFPWSPCLLLIAESISLDTSGKPTVVFFLKISSSS